MIYAVAANHNTPTMLKTSDHSTHATSHVVFPSHYLTKASRSSIVLSRDLRCAKDVLLVEA